MQHARADVVVTLDADGQDDPEAIVHMLQLYYEGYEVVYGVRASRRTDTRVKRVPAKSYYRLLRMLGIRIIYNHAEYRLVSARVLRALDEYTEVNLFLRGIFPEMGFRAGLVYYPRMKRMQGSSKYNLARLWRLAMDGITSFSTAPLRVVTVAGLLTFVLTFVLSGYALYSYLRLDTVPGWASTVLPIYFIGGVQLISIGIMGEYLAKIYMETKRRPRYLVEEQLD
jgi:glycosyltransferase involved in cell wall biosynthesis